MVAHHFHVTLLPLGTLAGINVRLARERTGRTHKRTQPRVKQYQFLMSWPKLALPSMTAVVRKAVLPVKSSPPAVTTCAARKPEFRRLSLHCFFWSPISRYGFLFIHIETHLRVLIGKYTSVQRIRARKEQVHCCIRRDTHVIIPS